MDEPVHAGIITSPDLFSTIETDALSRGLPKLIIHLGGVTAVGIQEIVIEEARKMLLTRSSSECLRDAVWAVLIRNAGVRPRFWRPVAVWVMVPFLRSIVRRLHRAWGGDLQDLRSEVVVSFLEALRQADPGQSHLGRRLWWNTYRIARLMCVQAACERPSPAVERLVAGARACEPLELESIGTDGVPGGELDAQVIESVRLGSLAARLGLRAVIARHQADADTANVIFLPPSRRSRKSDAVGVRGSGSGEAA